MNHTDPARRSRDLAAIHATAKQLDMDTHDQNPDTEYRSILWTIGRVRSCKDLDFTGLQRVKAHLQQLASARGIKSPRAYYAKKYANPPPGRPTPAPDRAPMVRKIRAILAEAGRDHAYADSMAMSMFHVKRYEWLPPDQMHGLVAALVKDQKRRNVRADKAAGPR